MWEGGGVRVWVRVWVSEGVRMSEGVRVSEGVGEWVSEGVGE